MKELTQKMTRWMVAAIALAAVMVGGGGAEQVAMAQDMEVEVEDEDIASLEEGPIVRRRLLYRSGRMEIEPRVAFTTNDALLRNILPGLAFNYYLNNTFGVGASFGFGALQMDTSLKSSLEATLSDDQLAETSYSRIGWAGDFSAVYVPLFGKFTIMNSLITHYDVHLFGGMSIINEVAESAAGDAGNDPDPVLGGLRPGGMFGAGMRFFMNERLALNFQVRNNIFPRAQLSQGGAEPGLKNTVMMSVGVGIFLPGDVKISR